MGIGVYAIIARANSEKPFFHCSILESIYLIFLVSLLLYITLHVYFFIVIIELYLEFKEAEPAVVTEEPEICVVKEEELQLLETPKLNADETDQSETKKTEAETQDEAKSGKKIRCPELPKCPSIKCPSWGNCVSPDNFS